MKLYRELLARLETLQIPSRKRRAAQHRGEKPGARKGSSVEFSDYREYLPGDDIRTIDWNVYARMERLFLKLFLEEQSKPVYFLVDASSSMEFGNPQKFEYAISLAAGLSYICLKRYDHPRILLLQGKAFRTFSFRSLKQYFPLLTQIEQAEPAGETWLNSVLKKVALARYPRGIYFLISDFLSPDGFDGIKSLATAGNEIYCLQILSPEEVQPGLRGDLRLIDSETSDHTEVSISPQVLRKYSARLHALQQEIQRIAHASGSRYHRVITSIPVESLLLHELRKVGILV